MKQNMLTEGLVPTGDAKLDAKAAKEWVLSSTIIWPPCSPHYTSLESQIAKLKRNQERRIDRKNKKIAKEGGEPLLTAPVVKSETSRKCGNCGEMGHMSKPISDTISLLVTNALVRNQSQMSTVARVQQGHTSEPEPDSRRVDIRPWYGSQSHCWFWLLRCSKYRCHSVHEHHEVCRRICAVTVHKNRHPTSCPALLHSQDTFAIGDQSSNRRAVHIWKAEEPCRRQRELKHD